MTSVEDFLQEKFQRISNYIRTENLEAFRLTCSSQEFPCAIDMYGDYAVIHVFGRIRPEKLQSVEKWLKEKLKVKGCFYKNRTKTDMVLPASKPVEMIVRESGHLFAINLSEYLDVGLFLDHRENRRWVEKRSKNKKVLNTFAYTGSFSVYAALGGAQKTWSVDLSRTYCDWIKKNLELNGLSPENNWVYKMDTLEFFSYAKRKNLHFDIIIIDPPTFSKNKKTHFSVDKDHPALINGALEILAPDGFIFFSNNFKGFVLKKNEIGPCTVERQSLIPEDFKGNEPHQAFIIRKEK